MSGPTLQTSMPVSVLSRGWQQQQDLDVGHTHKFQTPVWQTLVAAPCRLIDKATSSGYFKIETIGSLLIKIELIHMSADS